MLLICIRIIISNVFEKEKKNLYLTRAFKEHQEYSVSTLGNPNEIVIYHSLIFSGFLNEYPSEGEG